MRVTAGGEAFLDDQGAVLADLPDLPCVVCPRGYRCMHVNNPYHGFLHFDNVAYSFVSVFVVLTGEGWADVMYRAAYGTSWVALLYFVPVVLIGSNLMMLNLLLAAIKASFTAAATRINKAIKSKSAQKILQAAERSLSERGNSSSFSAASFGTGLVQGWAQSKSPWLRLT